MGSFEFQEGTTDCCPWDLDDSGLVGASDLFALLANWGRCLKRFVSISGTTESNGARFLFFLQD